MRYLLIFLTFLASPTFANDFTRTGYFKDSDRNRVMVYTAAEGDNPSDVLDEISNDAHTEGQVTIIFVYPHGSEAPADFITLAPDYWTAVERMYLPETAHWRWVYVMSPGGDKKSFTDCATDWAEGLCPPPPLKNS